ncbi:MAG: rRNA maturation RNase YbeY [Gemmatimonadota bacterium]|nr:rRNA maturation RNase YbeY [Gemmatimonadota bacterium]
MTGSQDPSVIVNVGDFEGAPEALLRSAVVHTLESEAAGPSEVSVTLLRDPEIRALNREYLSEDRPTDVIAFSLGDDGSIVGDVYVGVEQAERQSTELGIDLDEELCRLAIHGTLHVLGHDHPEGEERTACLMYRLQERLLVEALSGR